MTQLYFDGINDVLDRISNKTNKEISRKPFSFCLFSLTHGMSGPLHAFHFTTYNFESIHKTQSFRVVEMSSHVLSLLHCIEARKR